MSAIRVRSGSPEQTKAIAAAVAGCCEVGDVVLLAGELGAGKTVFAQGFAAGLGVTGEVTSPTFTLVNQYRCAHPRIATMLHADVYRLNGPAEVEDLGIGELVEDGAVAVVEWGDLAAPVLGRGALSVTIAAGDGAESDRLIELRPLDGEAVPGWSGRAGALRGCLEAWTAP